MIMTLAKNKILKGLAMALIAGQLAISINFVLMPKKAEAFWGIGDFTFNTEVANWYDVFKDISLAAAERIAISYANKYLTKFVDKLVDKYRIKNYLYYEKVLSGYYLNQYIYDNVDDPDLRAIYNLLATDLKNRATVTDPKTGKKQPVLAALKEKIDNFYYKRGGVDPNYITNPPGWLTAQEYYSLSYLYYGRTPNFTAQTLRSEFGDIDASSETAAEQEIAAGKGLKNDRAPLDGVIPKVCVGFQKLPNENNDPLLNQNPRSSKAACEAQAGKWEVDATGLAQSVIQNPSGFIHDFATGAIKQVFEANFGKSNSIYSAIGSLLGNFIFKKLNLDNNRKSDNGFDGTLNEKGDKYDSKDAAAVPRVKDIDADGDNIPDGQDVDGDGKLQSVTDTCYHGGTPNKPPGCTGSESAVTSPYFTPICQAIDRTVTILTTYANFIEEHADHFKKGENLRGKIIGVILAAPVGFKLRVVYDDGIDNLKNKADADIWARRSGEANSAIDDIINTIQNYHSTYFDNTEIALSRYNHFMSAVQQSLQKDGDLDLEGFGFNILHGGSNGGGGLENLMKNTAYILRYLKEIKVKIGKCEDPNLKVVPDIPAPEIEDIGDDIEYDECSNGWKFVLAEKTAAPKYVGDVQGAGRAAINENRSLAEAIRYSPSDRSGDRAAGDQLVAAVVRKLRAQGYTAGAATNCNGSYHTYENIMVYRAADSLGEFYSLYRDEAGVTYAVAADRRGYGMFVGRGSKAMCTGCSP